MTAFGRNFWSSFKTSFANSPPTGFQGAERSCTRTSKPSALASSLSSNSILFSPSKLTERAKNSASTLSSSNFTIDKFTLSFGILSSLLKLRTPWENEFTRAKILSPSAKISALPPSFFMAIFSFSLCRSFWLITSALADDGMELLLSPPSNFTILQPFSRKNLAKILIAFGMSLCISFPECPPG